jgi:hypothetical protein
MHHETLKKYDHVTVHPWRRLFKEFVPFFSPWDRLSIFDENFFRPMVSLLRLRGMDDVTMIFIESVLLKTCSDADAQVADNSFHVVDFCAWV